MNILSIVAFLLARQIGEELLSKADQYLSRRLSQVFIFRFQLLWRILAVRRYVEKYKVNRIVINKIRTYTHLRKEGFPNTEHDLNPNFFNLAIGQNPL